MRAYVQEKAELEKFESLNLLYVDQNIRLARLSALFNPLLQALVGAMFLIVLWAGGYRMMTHHITLGQFVMFNTFMGLLIWPMIALGWVVNLMQRGKASLGRIMEIMDEQPAIAAPPEPVPLPTNLRGEIRFDGVGVTYPAGAALKRVDLEIPGGATVAIVGHTGSGKSTLVSLIPRMLDTTAGSVLVDGLDVRALEPEELRRQIGFVPQETFLFSATLAENIAWGVAGADRASIERAAELAGLAPDIATFPAGLDTMVGERGLTLSGGQKQRTAIARALLRDPRILILDDALVQRGYHHRGAHTRRTGADHARPHHYPDFAPRLHRAPRRPHLRPRARRTGGAGDPRRAHSAPAATTRTCTRSSCWKRSWRRSEVLCGADCQADLYQK